MGKGMQSAPRRTLNTLQRWASKAIQFLGHSLRGTLVLLALAIVVPLTLVQVGLNLSRYQMQRDQALQSNLEMARAVAAAFQAYIEDILQLESAVGLALTCHPDLPRQDAQRMLAAALAESPTLSDLTWLDPSGRIIATGCGQASGRDMSERDYVRAILAGRDWAVSDLLTGRISGRPVFVVARALRTQNGALQGIIVAVIDPQRLGRVLPVTRAGGGAIAIADRAGRGVYRFPEVKVSWEQQGWSQSIALEEALYRGETAGIYKSVFDGQENVAGLAPIELLGWVAIASQPSSEALAPAMVGVLRDLVIVLLATCAGVLAAVQVGHRITRPIRQLRQYAAAVGRGELGHRAKVQGPRELEELASALSLMASEIGRRAKRQAYLLDELQRSNQLESRARARAEAAEERAAIRAEVSSLLAGSLDAESIMQKLAHYTVPRSADWCIAQLAEGQDLHLVAAVHADPTKEAALRDLAACAGRVSQDHPLCSALKLGQICIFPEIGDDLLAQLGQGLEQGIRTVGYGSAIIVPLTAHDRILGLITLMSARPDLRYSPAELSLVEDLARRAALAVENAFLYREAQEAIRFRDEFLSIAAHELKTPITSLRGFAGLTIRRLDKTGTIEPERLRRALESIDQQSDKLARLISQLLDISRIRSGRLVLEREEVDLAALVSGAAAIVQAGTSRHTITVWAPAPVPALLDPLRIEQVAINLMGNAVKYSPAGGPIEVRVWAPEPNTVRLEVRDHGIGVRPEDRERIFSRFVQAQSGYGGMGLGLYISQHIVELHGGYIEHQAPPDGGSRFIVSLPSHPGAGDDAGTPGDPC